MHSMTLDEQITLTGKIMEILDGWGLSAEEIISLLALPAKNADTRITPLPW